MANPPAIQTANVHIIHIDACCVSSKAFYYYYVNIDEGLVGMH